MRNLSLIAALMSFTMLLACGSDSEETGKKKVTPGEDTLVWGKHDTIEQEDTLDDDPACVPDCLGKQCGGDGCGGFCGTCEGGKICSGGLCQDQTVNPCQGKECGPDGQGGSCGTCDLGKQCNAQGVCVAVSTDLDCKGLQLCYSQCQDQECAEECYNKATADAQALDDALYQCLVDNGFFECQNSQCQDGIITGVCSSQYKACIPPGTKSCKEIDDCMSACPVEGWNNCALACIADGSEQGKNQHDDLVSCLINNGYNDCATNECRSDVIVSKCADEFDTCMEATKDCKWFWDCLGECAQGDAECQGECQAQTKIDGLMKYDAFVGCIINACGNPPEQSCFDNAKSSTCSVSFSECFAVI